MAGIAFAGYGLMFVLPGMGRVELAVYGLIVTIVAFYFSREIFKTDAKVVVDRRGVFDKRLGVGTIRWADINGIYVQQMKGIDHVCLEVANEEHYLEKRSWTVNAAAKVLRATNTISPFNINTGVLDAGPDEIYAAIVRGCEYYTGEHPHGHEAH